MLVSPAEHVGGHRAPNTSAASLGLGRDLREVDAPLRHAQVRRPVVQERVTDDAPIALRDKELVVVAVAVLAPLRQDLIVALRDDS